MYMFWINLFGINKEEDNKMSLEEFTKEMEKILTEKYDKYKDTWKDCPINLIIYKLSKQLDALYEADIDRSERIAIHIANYAYLLYQRLKEND